MNCGWEEPTCWIDCDKEQEEYFAKTKDEMEKKFQCFNSAVVVEIVETGKDKADAEADAYIKDVNKMIEQSRERGLDAFPEFWKEVPSLKGYTGPSEDGSAKHHLKRTLNLAWIKDREQIILFTRKTIRKMAIVPNLDGTFGGKPCVRNSDKKQLTIRHSDDKKFDKKTMFNGIPRDQQEFFGVGHFQITFLCHL